MTRKKLSALTEKNRGRYIILSFLHLIADITDNVSQENSFQVLSFASLSGISDPAPPEKTGEITWKKTAIIT